MSADAGLRFLPRLVTALERERISFALVGAFALMVRNASRSTFDVDFLTTQSSALHVLWREHFPDVQVYVRPGDHDDPLAGVVRFEPADELSYDLVIGRWKWQQHAIDRAEPLEIAGVTLPVATVVDLCLMKIDAGSPKDWNDAALLLERHPSLRESLRSVVQLPPSLREAVELFLKRA